VTLVEHEGLTVEDLEAMPDDGRRYELIGGAIVMTPAPDLGHQRGSGRLYRLLVEACPDGHEVFAAPTDLDLPGGQRVQPDLVVTPVRGANDRRLELPVLLVVEIVSPGSRTNDRVTKPAAYAEAGIPAYWIVDPRRKHTACLRLADDGAYEAYAEGDEITVDRPLAEPVSFRTSALLTP